MDLERKIYLPADGFDETKVNLEDSAPSLIIDSIEREMFSQSPFDTDESQPFSELDSSQELYSSGELGHPLRSIHHSRHSKDVPPEDSSKWAHDNSKISPQSGKRCGVIFVDMEAPPKSFDYRNLSERLIFFLVVMGRCSGIWSFAKGRLKSDTESDEECAIREVYEETGIRLASIAGMPKIIIGRNVYFIYHCKMQSFNSFKIQDKYEVGEVAWKSVSDLRKLTANKDVRAVLRYPNRVFPYHRIIYSPPKLTRTKHSFKNVTKFIDAVGPPPSVEVC